MKIERRLPSLALALVAGGTAWLHAEPRIFTDDQGRQVEAELVGLRGANVVLATGAVRGQWPLARLSAPDQAYVKDWQASNTAVKNVQVQIFEREGIGQKGAFPAPAPEGPSLPDDLPFPGGKEVKADYHHCDLAVQNPAEVDANHIRVAYVLYLVKADGSVGNNAASQPVDRITARGNSRITTEGINAARTKATKFRIQLTDGNLSVDEKTVRSRDGFGGCWVRVYGADGTIIGEAKHLSPALARLDPPWVEADVKEDIPILPSLEGLRELLGKMAPKAPPGGGLPKPGPPFQPPR